MLPLDTHAHIEPDIASSELDMLNACVIAMTRTQQEYEQVMQRTDRSVVWGIGCHPGLAEAVRGFSVEVFRAALSGAAVVGEVGLDGSSKVSFADQLEVFDQIIKTLAETPLLASVHSYRATGSVLDVIGRHRPRGIVLHWWLGDEAETARAIELGAYFSVNAAQVAKWAALRLVPRDRLLTETDHPFGDRRESAPRRPGNIRLVERRLAEFLGESPETVRRIVWHNFRCLADELALHDVLSHQFQVQLLAS